MFDSSLHANQLSMQVSILVLPSYRLFISVLMAALFLLLCTSHSRCTHTSQNQTEWAEGGVSKAKCLVEHLRCCPSGSVSFHMHAQLGGLSFGDGREKGST